MRGETDTPITFVGVRVSVNLDSHAAYMASKVARVFPEKVTRLRPKK